MLILRNSLQSLPKKALRKRKQHNSFPCNKWFDDECKHKKCTVNDIGKLLKRSPNNPDLISQHWL